jgi:hypothetical protein
MPASIFISHRRSDIGGHARALYERLLQWFDREQVFYDTDPREAGAVLPQHIEAAVRSARLVLVLIGPSWLSELNHRVQLPMRDYVSLEVALALHRQAEEGSVEIIPVLLDGAMPIPDATAIHVRARADLQGLCLLRAHEFQGKNLDSNRQFVALRELLANVPGVPAPRYRTPGGEQPFRVISRPLSPHFRDPNRALARVHECLQTQRRAAILAPAAAYGMGGLGKTQLALKYSHDYRDSYAGVWWFGAESETTMQLDACEACKETGAVAAEGELPMAAFMRWLGRQQQRWLLVFDNVEYDQESKRTTLPAGCLQLRRHHLLLTSRHPVLSAVAAPIELSGWSEPAGADFLATRLSRAPRVELERLSRTLGGLPLALEQAAALLQELGGSVANYGLQLEAVDSSALMLVEGRASTRFERIVLATLSLTYRHLTPAAQQLLRLCAFYSAAPIPERYFLESSKYLPMELAAATQSTLTWNQVAGELQRFGIAERWELPPDRSPGHLESAGEPVLSLHRLTLEVARRMLSVAPEDGPRAQRVLFAQCLGDPRDTAQWPRIATLQPHLMQLDRSRSMRWLDRHSHAWMLNCVATYLQARGNLPGTRELQERVAALRPRTEGVEHSQPSV